MASISTSPIVRRRSRAERQRLGQLEHGRYEELNNIPCYGDQTIALVFVLHPDASRLGCGSWSATVHRPASLGLRPMIRAPEWTMNVGFDYEIPVGSKHETAAHEQQPDFVAVCHVPRRGRPATTTISQMTSSGRCRHRVEGSRGPLGDRHDRQEHHR